MELEAKIAEDMDSESSDETTSMELTPVDNALPSQSSTLDPPLTTVTPALSSTPKASTSSSLTPAVSSSSTVTSLSLEPPAMSSLSFLTPLYLTISSEPSLPTPAFARVTLTPAHHPLIVSVYQWSTTTRKQPFSLGLIIFISTHKDKFLSASLHQSNSHQCTRPWDWRSAVGNRKQPKPTGSEQPFFLDAALSSSICQPGLEHTTSLFRS